MAARVMTVTGPVPPDRIGFTLPHEHTGVRLWGAPAREDYWELRKDEDLLAEELADFRRRGGSCLVDLTTDEIGRDPRWLRRLASRTGVFIVMGSGWYRQLHYPPDSVDRRTVDELAGIIVREFEEGVASTGVRPGIIGEIGTDKWWVSAQEERVLRAAARAARRTGLAVSTHALASDVGLAQLEVLTDEGLDPVRVVVGHADTYPDLDYHLAVLARGASVQFDTLGTPEAARREPRAVALIVELLERGYASQILLSHDVCHDDHLRANGGNGYGYLAQHFLPALRTAAVAEGEIRQMTVENPRRILTIG